MPERTMREAVSDRVLGLLSLGEGKTPTGGLGFFLEGEDTLQAFRVRTQTGHPLASDSFMSRIETFLGRRVRPLPVGRQQRWRKSKTMATDQ